MTAELLSLKLAPVPDAYQRFRKLVELESGVAELTRKKGSLEGKHTLPSTGQNERFSPRETASRSACRLRSLASERGELLLGEWNSICGGRIVGDGCRGLAVELDNLFLVA